MAPIQNDISLLLEENTNDIYDRLESKRKSEEIENPDTSVIFPATSFSSTQDEDDKFHQIMFDVQDFKDGDVKVKVVDDDEVVVEGNIERQRDGSVTKKSFCRRFLFPGLDCEQNVSASISSDGVLTINVAKKEALSEKEQNKVVENITSNKNCEAIRDERGVLTNPNMKDLKVERIVNSSVKNVKHQIELKDAQDSKGSAEESPDSSHDLIPICERGLYLQDSFFEDIRKEFEAVVDRMFDVFEQDVSSSDSMNSDRNLQRHDNEETHCITLREDQQCFKVVLDVRGYPSEDVRVRVEDKEVVVEGSVEKEEDSFRSTKSFCRRFNFPAEVYLKGLTSAVSSDGVLTITAPKIVQRKEE